MLFRLNNLGKEFKGEWILRQINAQCNPEDRIGLIGRNGSGKTSLLNLIQGGLPPDEGQVERISAIQISRVEQIPDCDPNCTVREEALKVFAGFKEMEARLETLEARMAELQSAVPPGLAEEYEKLRLQMRLHGGYDYPARTEAVLHGLGFSDEMFDSPCHHLSGGQVSRLLLARALLRPADLLLLDEPTNHLDIRGIMWLTTYLNERSLTFVLVSHDRHFLDAVTRRTWELDRGGLQDYSASFTGARRMRSVQLELQEKLYQRQQEWKTKTEEYIRRNIAGQKTRQAQSRRKQLEKAEWLESPLTDSRGPSLNIQEAGRGGSLTFQIVKGNIGFPGKAIIDGVNLVIRRGDRVGILGGNASGKTTLLRTILGELPLLSGKLKWGLNNVPAYFSQGGSFDNEEQTVYEALRDLDISATDLELRNWAARFLFKEDDVFKPIRKLSGGERSRLALARLFYHPANVLILDEPTNHLDIPSREALEQALADYQGTLICVSHDLYFLERVTAQFYLIRSRLLQPVPSLQYLEDLLIEAVKDEAEGEKRLKSQEKTVPREEEKGPNTDQAMIPPPTHEDESNSLLGTSSRSATQVRLSKNERMRRERRIQEIENQIEGLEDEKRTVTESMQSRYDDFVGLRDLSERYQQLEANLQELYQEWEQIHSQLVDSSS